MILVLPTYFLMYVYLGLTHLSLGEDSQGEHLQSVVIFLVTDGCGEFRNFLHPPFPEFLDYCVEISPVVCKKTKVNL